MGKTYLITSGKGGSGKTTVTALLGRCLAHKGKTVLMIDGNFGMRDLDLVLGLENDCIYHILDVINEKCSLQEVLISDKEEGLHFLPGPPLTLPQEEQEEKLTEFCRQMEEKYDFILLDSPPGMGQGFVNLAKASSEAIIVTENNPSSLRCADRIRQSLFDLNIRNAKLLINRYTNKENIEKIQSEDISLKDMEDLLGLTILGVLPETGCVSKELESLFAEEKSLYAGMAINAADRLLDGAVPLEDIPLESSTDAENTSTEKKKSFFARLFSR